MTIEGKPEINRANTERLISATNIADRGLTSEQTEILNEYNRIRGIIIFGLSLQKRYIGGLGGVTIESLAAKEAAKIVPKADEVMDLWITAFRQALHK